MTNAHAPLVEAFLIVEQPRQRLSHWTQTLAALDSPHAPALAAIIAFYDPTTDQALLNLRYDEIALGPKQLDFIIEIALLAEVGMIQPHQLSGAERNRFLIDRLSRCTHQVTYQRNVIGALTELVRKVKEQKSAGVTKAVSKTLATPLPRQPPPIPAAARKPPPEVEQTSERWGAKTTPERASERRQPSPSIDGTYSDRKPAKAIVEVVSERWGTAPILDGASARWPIARGDTRDPVLLEEPVLLVPAKGTRSDLEHVEGTADVNRAATDDVATVASGSGGRPAYAGGTRPPPAPLPRASRRDDTNLATPQNALHKAQQPTVEMPVAPLPPPSFRDPEVELLDRSTARRAWSPSSVSPHLLAAESRPQPQPPGIIYARYLRSGKWVAIRVGALNIKGAALMAVAMPRLHDHIDLALSFAGHRALVRAAVTKVSSHGEARTTGASSFTVTFELDDASRRPLTSLLTAARDANVTIKPPPPRSTRRYPVEWPICLGTSRGALKADALDVSTHGMFVRPTSNLTLDAVVNFSITLDDNAPPIAGRARVVRQISDAEAKAAGLTAGYGLHIMDIAEPDRMRWLGFLARIERRAEKRVLIGASPARLLELQTALSAIGYAVTGGTDSAALAELATSEARPVDAALIDGGWIDSNGVETVFSARNVPCVTLYGDARRARIAIDKLLAVAV